MQLEGGQPDDFSFRPEIKKAVQVSMEEPRGRYACFMKLHLFLYKLFKTMRKKLLFGSFFFLMTESIFHIFVAAILQNNKNDIKQ